MNSNDNNLPPQKKKIISTLDEKLVDKLPINRLTNANIVANLYNSSGFTSTPINSCNSLPVLPDGTQPIPLGSGVIDGLLGEGGMARVYRIWNEQLELYRAVKIFHLTGRPELLKRFETEIKISAKLHHPNIIETHTVGEWNGLPYIEMELVEGISLEDLIIQNVRLPIEVVVAIGIQVADALCYAHNQKILLYGKSYNGIIHRDLKPANIMLSSSGIVKLLDFGIARPSEVGLHTIAGNIVGTLPYLSPEQLDNRGIDYRSDIYSLGTILYEALTGDKTFPQETTTALMKMKSIGQYRKFDSFSCNIPSKLTKIVEKCLYENKEKRFSSSLELKRALLKSFKRSDAESPSEILVNYLQKKDDSGTTIVKIKNKTSLTLISGLIVGIGLIIASVFSLQTQILKKKNSSVLIANADSALQNIAIATKYDSSSINTLNHNIQGHLVEPVNGIKPLTKADNSTTTATGKTAVSTLKKVPAQKPKDTKDSVIDKLKSSYKQDDIVKIGEIACKMHKFSDAILALENIPPNHPDKENGLILLAYAYLEKNRVADALNISMSISSDDAFSHILKGRLAIERKDDNGALEHFQFAITRPSNIFPANFIRSESLYYTALIYANRYTTNPTAENRQHSIIAWNNLKRIHTTEHERFILANQKLSEF